VRPFEDRGAAHLALIQLVLGTVRLHECLVFSTAAIAGIGVLRVGMIDPVVDQIQLVGGLQGVQHEDAIGIMDRRNKNDRLRLNLSDDLAGGKDQSGVVLALAKGFVPDLPFGNDVFVARHGGRDVLQPGRHGLFRSDQRSQPDPKLSFEPVDRVSIAQAHPWLHRLLVEAVNALVKPVELVDALLLFALGPAALDAGVFDA